MNFLNNGNGYELFREEAMMDTYVDKSLMIDELYRYTQRVKKYVCVTRPRRFGKTVAANMIAAFFDESVREKSRDLFLTLNIGARKEEQQRVMDTAPDGREAAGLCWGVQGRQKVIHINMLDLLTPEIKSYEDFYQSLKELLFIDIKSAYPHLTIRDRAGIPEVLNATGKKYVFVIDEWDAVFEANFLTNTHGQARGVA